MHHLVQPKAPTIHGRNLFQLQFQAHVAIGHWFKDFPSRNKLFKHLRSDCILARDDPNIDSAIKLTVLPKYLKQQNLDKWDPDSINLDAVANLPSWCKEPDNRKSPAAFQRTLE